MKISVVSPVYGAEKIIPELVLQIRNALEKITKDYEILLVEDGSPDKSWAAILHECHKDPMHVKGIKLSRNFGQHYAITAGLHNSSGDYVVVMDCDLQDDPVYIPSMYDQICNGYDIVFTNKENRKHSFFKNITATTFNRIFNWLVDNKNWSSSGTVGSYSMLSRKVVEAFINYKDYRRHYLMVLRWLGFQSTSIQIEHKERYQGKSSYNLSKLLNHAIDGITSQSDKLLRLTVLLGFFLSFISFLSGVYIFIQSFIKPFQSGWASLSILILFVGGLTITSIGFSAIYIGKIFEQTKGRPLFIIDQKINI